MTINFEKIYSSLAEDLSGKQKRLNIDCSIGVFYGLNKDGNFRLSFLSSRAGNKMESTKLIKVHQWKESAEVYWTCFDLVKPEAQRAFYLFCANLIESIVDEKDEYQALLSLKKRYFVWKSLFSKEPKEGLSREIVQGLFGELYFMKKVLMEKYDVAKVINSWSGPDLMSKDFSIDDTWYEIKTIGANSTVVKISSLAQLSSENTGHLSVIKVEQMSPEFSNGESSVEELFKSILNDLKDEVVESNFINKITSFGVGLINECFSIKFSVKDICSYLVNDEFPRLTEKDVIRSEICDIKYSLILNAISKYKE